MTTNARIHCTVVNNLAAVTATAMFTTSTTVRIKKAGGFRGVASEARLGVQGQRRSGGVYIEPRRLWGLLSLSCIRQEHVAHRI